MAGVLNFLSFCTQAVMMNIEETSDSELSNFYSSEEEEEVVEVFNGLGQAVNLNPNTRKIKSKVPLIRRGVRGKYRSPNKDQGRVSLKTNLKPYSGTLAFKCTPPQRIPSDDFRAVNFLLVCFYR